MATRGRQEALPLSVSVEFKIAPTAYKHIFRVGVPFDRIDGQPWQIYLAKPKGSDRYVLSDGSSVLNEAKAANITLRPEMLRQLVNSYGLKLSEDLMIFEESNDTLALRIARFAQVIVAMEGILRMWGLNAPTRVNAPREGKGINYADAEGSSECSDAAVGTRRRNSNGSASRPVRPKRKTAGVRTRKR